MKAVASFSQRRRLEFFAMPVKDLTERTRTKSYLEKYQIIPALVNLRLDLGETCENILNVEAIQEKPNASLYSEKS